MLRFTPEQVQVMEAALLARWNREIAASLAALYPTDAKRLGRDAVTELIRQAMVATQKIGGETFDDFMEVTTALFLTGEVQHDDQALADLTALLLAEETFAAKLTQLRLCVSTIVARQS